MRPTLILVLCLLAALAVRAQVSNDKVANRIRLVPDGSPLRSTTASSTVEWGCLNQALTGKCLVYHNDQWYQFSVKEPQAYFLNISRLACRNSNGIQVILIEGNPCETKNYRVIDCIRQIKNEEVFVSLGKVTADTPYLIEIDGFDGDHCDFDIQIARKPFGMPMVQEEFRNSGAATRPRTQYDSIVNVAWRVPLGLLDQIDHFRMYRLTHNDIFKLERVLPASRNAYGKPSDTYQLQDTLSSPGEYLYRVLGYPQEGNPALMTQVLIEYGVRKKPPPAPQALAVTQTIVIDPGFNVTVDYVVRVYETEQLSVIHGLTGSYDPDSPSPIRMDMKEFVAKGYKSFMVVLINRATRESKDYYFRVDERGSVVLD